MPLRDYQDIAIEKILKEFKISDSILLQMPTGTGKTTVFSEIVRRWIKEIVPNKRLLIMVHRKELVDQIIKRLKDFGIGAGRIQAGYSPDLLKRVQVGMVQSLRNPNRLPQNISLIIIDEAHHSPALSYRNIIKNYGEGVKILGVTATPCRMNGEGFADLFSSLITSDSIKTFIQNGYLSSLKHLATSIPDLSKVKFNRRINDYDEDDLEKVVRNEQVMAELIESYQKYANGKKSIVFALNKNHSKDIVNRFNAKGIPSTFIDSDTPVQERNEIVKDFKEGRYLILCNVNIFSEGFDCPDVEVVQLARPTKSIILYLQQVGRVMRPFEGKEYGLILDNACLWKEHGLVTQNFQWTLEGGIIRDSKTIVFAKTSEDETISTNKPLEVLGLELIEIENFESGIDKIIESPILNIEKEKSDLTNVELEFLLDFNMRSHKTIEALGGIFGDKQGRIEVTDNFGNSISVIKEISDNELLFKLGVIKKIDQITYKLVDFANKLKNLGIDDLRAGFTEIDHLKFTFYALKRLELEKIDLRDKDYVLQIFNEERIQKFGEILYQNNFSDEIQLQNLVKKVNVKVEPIYSSILDKFNKQSHFPAIVLSIGNIESIDKNYLKITLK